MNLSKEVEDIHLSSSSESDTDDDYSPANTANKVVAATPKTITEKEDIVTKYADKIKTDPIKKGPKITKDRANRATVEQVLDPRTLSFWQKLSIKESSLVSMGVLVLVKKQMFIMVQVMIQKIQKNML